MGSTVPWGHPSCKTKTQKLAELGENIPEGGSVGKCPEVADSFWPGFDFLKFSLLILLVYFTGKWFFA